MLDWIVERGLQDLRIARAGFERFAAFAGRFDRRGTLPTRWKAHLCGSFRASGPSSGSRSTLCLGLHLPPAMQREIQAIQQRAGIHPSFGFVANSRSAAGTRNSGSPMRPTHCASGSVTSTSASERPRRAGDQFEWRLHFRAIGLFRPELRRINHRFQHGANFAVAVIRNVCAMRSTRAGGGLSRNEVAR